MLLTTHCRTLLSEWKALAKLIVTHSTPVKEKVITQIEELENFDIESLEDITFSTVEELPNILTEKQITTVLQGPFAAHLQQKMAAYAKICRFRLELHLNKEEMFKNKRLTLPENEQISPKRLLKLSFGNLDQLQNELDELTKQHDQQWCDWLAEQTERLMMHLVKSKITLTDREKKELNDEDTAPDLLPRLIELSITLPKVASSYATMNFADYLQLKAILAIQSSLSRQHLPHGNTEIDAVLKPFQKELIQMQKSEQQLLNEQQNATEQCLSLLD